MRAVIPSIAPARVIAVDSALTIADGIAVKRPGELTLALIRRVGRRVIVVPEDDVAEAMVFLLERAKLVVEGAGAVGVAALLCGRLAGSAGDGTTVVILSGGNVDAGSARGYRAPPREPGGTPARAARAAARPPRLARAAAGARRRMGRERARRPAHPRGASTSTSVRPRCSSCSRRAAPRPRAGGERAVRERGLRRAAAVAVAARLLDERADHAAVSRLPRGATGRRARTGLLTAPRSPRAARRASSGR